MKKQISLTIGIPAYNEETNIGFLIKSLLLQNYKKINLEKILIVSDGSTDKTVQITKKMKDKLIKILDRKKRLGIIKTQNEILKHSSSDILVMLDADVLPTSQNFILQLIKPILKDRSVGLVGADTNTSTPQNLFEKILNDSHEMKKEIYSYINNGNNIYFCHGRARAFSKPFYKTLTWQSTHPEDAFSYLFCISHGFKFVIQKNAVVKFRSPTSIKDHAKQSLRFIGGKKQLEKYFDIEVVKKEYKLPKIAIFKVLLKNLYRNTFSTAFYILINLYINILNIKSKNISSKWDISKSTKKVII